MYGSVRKMNFALIKTSKIANLNLVFTRDISIRKITKFNYRSEVYEDEAEKNFF